MLNQPVLGLKRKLISFGLSEIVAPPIWEFALALSFSPKYWAEEQYVRID
jgi:hypothetical protein